MADTKPSQPASPDPIALKDLIQSFAATVVTTSQHLDQATVELRNLYVNSGNLGLAAMMPPRYLLDEVTIDVAFVVVEAKPDVPETHDLPAADKKVNNTVLQPADSDVLYAKLAGLSKDAAKADAQAKSAQAQASINNLQKKVSDGEASVSTAQNSLTKAQSDFAKAQNNSAKAQNELAEAQKQLTVRKPPKNLPDPAAPLRLAQAQTALNTARTAAGQAQAALNQAQSTFNSLHAQFAPGGSISTSWGQQIEAQNQQKAKIDSAVTVLSDDTTLKTEQIASLRGLGIAYVDWGAKWHDFYEKYSSLHQAYNDAVKAFQSQTGLAKIDDFQLAADDQDVLQKIQDIPSKRGEAKDWNPVKKSVADIQTDYMNTLDALNALVRLITNVRGSGLQVRVDPKALADAPPEARQKLHLTFHGQSQEKVKVGETGTDVTA